MMGFSLEAGEGRRVSTISRDDLMPPLLSLKMKKGGLDPKNVWSLQTGQGETQSLGLQDGVPPSATICDFVLCKALLDS